MSQPPSPFDESDLPEIITEERSRFEFKVEELAPKGDVPAETATYDALFHGPDDKE